MFIIIIKKVVIVKQIMLGLYNNDKHVAYIVTAHAYQMAQSNLRNASGM